MKAELIDNMGSDLSVCNAARVSFDKKTDWDYFHGEKVLKSADLKLIEYLSKHNHYTPFTHCTITLRETVPIFVARQRFKHTVGFSYNEVSRRYVDSTPTFYFPKEWRRRAENKKQGSSDEIVAYKDHQVGYSYAVKNCLDTYEDMLEKGIAPEQARMVLPQSMYTSYFVTGSLYAFARAYKLRSTDDAQAEIRELAQQWDTILSKLYPISWSVLKEER